MGSSCSRPHSLNEAEATENAKSADIDRLILQETKAEQHIHKLLLLGSTYLLELKRAFCHVKYLLLCGLLS